MGDDLVERLRDLHKQATVERSHFYVGKCVADAIHRIEELEERLKAATDDAKEVEAYAGEMEAVLERIKAKVERLRTTLKKLEYWFDADQEVLDAMTPDERADHMRQLKRIRETLNNGGE